MTDKASKAEQIQQVQDLISALEEPDRSMALRIHSLVMAAAPDIEPKSFYGMPGYSLAGKNVLFFQSGIKFKTRYCTLGFSQAASLDDGQMWPTSFALVQLNEDIEDRITQLVIRATGK